jgi:hypothetical protein
MRILVKFKFYLSQKLLQVEILKPNFVLPNASIYCRIKSFYRHFHSHYKNIRGHSAFKKAAGDNGHLATLLGSLSVYAVLLTAVPPLYSKVTDKILQ